MFLTQIDRFGDWDERPFGQDFNKWKWNKECLDFAFAIYSDDIFDEEGKGMYGAAGISLYHSLHWFTRLTTGRSSYPGES